MKVRASYASCSIFSTTPTRCPLCQLDVPGGVEHTCTISPRPQRLQLSRRKGFRLPPGAVKVDRTTKWGNPFVVGEDGTRAECVELYTLLAAGGYLCVSKSAEHVERQKRALAALRTDLEALRGRDLACWCAHGTPCHADVLLALANGHPVTLPAVRPIA
jgi:hypothetical protein